MNPSYLAILTGFLLPFPHTVLPAGNPTMLPTHTAMLVGFLLPNQIPFFPAPNPTTLHTRTDLHLGILKGWYVIYLFDHPLCVATKGI